MPIKPTRSAASCSPARPGRFAPATTSPIFSKRRRAGALDTRAYEFLHALARSAKADGRRGRGVAIGIGTTMLFHCDHVVAGAGATLSTPFLKLALLPEAASTLLAPMRMGYARAFSLLVMGRPLSAAEARDAGLVNTVVDDAKVDDAALQGGAGDRRVAAADRRDDARADARPSRRHHQTDRS